MDLPAGFMELGETTAQGAARETDEEAGAQIEMQGLLTVLSVPRVGQVHLYYRARLLSDRFNPGHETIEARLFSENEIPWDELAFKTVRETLLRYFDDRRKGQLRGSQHRHRLTPRGAPTRPALVADLLSSRSLTSSRCLTHKG